jgi:SOS-response transcriptional repressor LexA
MSSGNEKGQPPRAQPQLTRAELDVLSALEDLTFELGYAPTYREMLARLGWSPKSKGSLHQYLKRLRQLGVVEGSGRSLRVLSPPRQNPRSDET